MKDVIMSLFETRNSKAGNIVTMRELNLNLLQKLNPKEQKEAVDSINSLIESGFITYEKGDSGIECIRLTELGFGSLYKNSKSVSDIERLIFNEFKRLNSKIGHILMIKNLNLSIFQNLNPVEIGYVTGAINNLISKGYIQYEDASSGPECLRLTELGYNNLY